MELTKIQEASKMIDANLGEALNLNRELINDIGGLLTQLMNINNSLKIIKKEINNE